ncbi:hypothetical protein PR048_002338 [Dryococelus australis]|uniref:Uncharacterized protein n=1 Tax=Dryococelus australis TaxID=614101 RepID=A0ABQ9IKM0_9NEOP|nr:hypothetical protein PR048_002338 [Dryococelus australis]
MDTRYPRFLEGDSTLVFPVSCGTTWPPYVHTPPPFRYYLARPKRKKRGAKLRSEANSAAGSAAISPVTGEGKAGITKGDPRNTNACCDKAVMTHAPPVLGRLHFLVLDYSPPIKASRARFLTGSFLDFHTWESCRTMPLVRGFFRCSPSFPRSCVPELLHTHLVSPSLALKTSILRAAQISPIHLYKTPTHRKTTVYLGLPRRCRDFPSQKYRDASRSIYCNQLREARGYLRGDLSSQ